MRKIANILHCLLPKLSILSAISAITSMACLRLMSMPSTFFFKKRMLSLSSIFICYVSYLLVAVLGVRRWELGLSTCLLVEPMTPR